MDVTLIEMSCEAAIVVAHGRFPGLEGSR